LLSSAINHSNLLDEINVLTVEIQRLRDSGELEEKLDYYLDKINAYFLDIINLSTEEQYLYKDEFQKLYETLDNVITKLSAQQTEIKDQIKLINIRLQAQKAYI